MKKNKLLLMNWWMASGGAVVAPVQATNLLFSNVTDNSLTLSWTRGNGAQVIIIGKKSGAVDSLPSNGITYAGNSFFGLGDELGTDNYVVYVGTGTSVNLINLDYNSTYHFRAFEFTGTTYFTDTATGNPASRLTDTYSALELAIFDKVSCAYLFEANGTGNYVNSAKSNNITLSGTSGTCNINVQGVNYLATFTTSLIVTAQNFVTTHGATLLALGITVTAHGLTTTGVLTFVGITQPITRASVSGNLLGTISDGAVSDATKPAIVSGVASFTGTEYFNVMSSGYRWMTIGSKIPNPVTGNLFRFNNSGSGVQVNMSSATAGNYGNISDVRRDTEDAETSNPSAALTGIKGDVWRLNSFVTSLQPTAGTRIGASNASATAILTDGDISVVVGANFVPTDLEIQYLHNYITKRLAISGRRLFSLVTPHNLVRKSITLGALPIQTIPSPYSPTDQITHPADIKMPAGSVYNYLRFATPYPGQVVGTENPCIWSGATLGDWTNISGVTNPFVPAPGGSGNFNSDVWAFPTGVNTFVVGWRTTIQGTSTTTYYHKEGTINLNGTITFGSDIILFTKLTGGTTPQQKTNILSPNVFYWPLVGKWVMIGVRYENAGDQVGDNVFAFQYADSYNGFNGTFTDCIMPVPVRLPPWHQEAQVDTILNTGLGVILSSDTETGGSAGNKNGLISYFVPVGTDAIKVYTSRQILMPFQTPAPQYQEQIYKLTLIQDPAGTTITYAGVGRISGVDNDHRIFQTTLTLP